MSLPSIVANEAHMNAYQSSSSSWSALTSLRMGILMPCAAKHLLSGVLSMTPGNFLAEKTWNLSEKT